MNERSIVDAEGGRPQGTWLDAYIPQESFAPQRPAPSFFNASALLGILYRQRWLIGGVLLGALVVGVVVTLLTTPEYKAVAKVSARPAGQYIVSGQDIDQGFAAIQIYDYLETQAEVVKSRNLALEVTKKLELASRNDLLGSEVDEERPTDMSDEEWKETKEGMLARVLAASVETEVAAGAWILSIGFRSEDPVLAAEISNGYVDALVASGSRNSLDSNRYALEYLEGQIEATRGRLSQAEQAANAYARGTGIVVQPGAGAGEGSGADTTLTASNLAEMNARVASARAARIEAEQRWLSIRNLPAPELPEVQSNPVLQSLVSERTAKLSQLSNLRQRYEDDFPQIRDLRAQLDIIDRQIEQSSSDIKGTVRNAFIVARNQERALNDELASLTGQRLAEQDQQIELSVLEREADALREQLQTLLTRYNEVNSATNLETGLITKLDSASVPPAPFSPNPVRNMGLSLVLGLGLAAGLAVARELLDDRVRSLDDIEEKIGLPLLGHTPYVDGSDLQEEEENSFSELMEAYSSIRAAIDFTLPRNRNVIQVTSTQAREGKSTTAVILAELFASMGRSTLLIDADMRRPSVATLMDLERPKVGLAEVLVGHVELEDALIKGSQSQLEILPVGELPPNPVELMASEELAALIERCREQYSMIIFDAPPIMGLADAPTLSGLVDGTVFVLEANRMPFGQAKSAVRRINMAGGKLLGVVLTKYRALQAGQSYDYQYEYYRYGNSK